MSETENFGPATPDGFRPEDLSLLDVFEGKGSAMALLALGTNRLRRHDLLPYNINNSLLLRIYAM
jgi:hypothetical protein